MLKSLYKCRGESNKDRGCSSVYVAVIVVKSQLLQLEDAKKVAGNSEYLVTQVSIKGANKGSEEVVQLCLD